MFEVTEVTDLVRAFRVGKTEHQADAMHVLPSPFFHRHRVRLAELAEQHRLPAIYEAPEYVEAGGLMSYGPRFSDMFRRAAGYVDKVLNGVKPADLPIEQPTRFELVINVKTATACANRVIEWMERRVFVGIVAALVVSGCASTSRAAEPVWDAMRAPGSVVVVRHSYAPGTFDPPGARLDDCTTQRNLDANGRAQARRIGEAFQKNGITVGAVLSSPRCRCLDTARLAFGRAEAMEPLQGTLRDSPRRQTFLEEIRARMKAHREGPPLVLVTHGSVVIDLTGLDVPMGAFVVLRREADGTHKVAGQLFVE